MFGRITSQGALACCEFMNGVIVFAITYFDLHTSMFVLGQNTANFVHGGKLMLCL